MSSAPKPEATAGDEVITWIARAWARASEPADADDDVLAAYALQLALDPAVWVRRRVETFAFVDAATVRRRMSVYFELPAGNGLERGQEVYVPVMLLRKQDFRNFDISDAEGNSLVIPTAERNAEIACGALLGKLRAIAAPHTLADGIEREVEAIVGKSERVRHREAIRAAIKAVEPGGRFHGLIERADAEERENLRELIRYLGRGFMLLVRLPYEPGSRRLVKFAYDVAHRVPRDPSAFDRAYLMFNRVAASFGLMARLEVMDGLAVGLATSYHAEAIPPAETYVADASLEVTPAGEEKPERQPYTDRHRFRPHVRAANRGRSDRGAFVLLIYAQRESLLVPLWFAALLITGALAFVPRHAAEIDGQTLSALLLVPFALAAFYIRSPENRYVTVMLRGVRLVAVVPVAAGALVIAMLGLGYLNPDPESMIVPPTALDMACYAAHASAGASAVLTVALVAPVAGALYRGVIRPLGDWAYDTSGRRAIVSAVFAVVMVATVVGAYLSARAVLPILDVGRDLCLKVP